MPKFEAIPLSFDGLNSPVVPDGGLNLYVSNPKVVDLPEEGKITFKFKRGPVTLREGRGESEGTASVDLSLYEICEVEECPVTGSAEPDRETENAIDDIFESIRGKKSEESEEDED
jgi:hypothetical protein